MAGPRALEWWGVGAQSHDRLRVAGGQRPRTPPRRTLDEYGAGCRPATDDAGLLPAGPDLLHSRILLAPRGGGTGLHDRRVLPADRPHARGRQVPRGVLRRSPGDARP